MIDLTAAGLNETEAKTYQALLTAPDWQPSKLATNVQETRTNMYKILDKLVGLRLAEKFDKNKKLHYRAANPSRLLELAREQRQAREQSEKELELQAEQLLHEYVKTHEQPGVRYFQGESEIADIFEEIAASSEEVVFIHSKAGIDFYGLNKLHDLRMLAAKNGVTRRALTPDTDTAPTDYEAADAKSLLSRTWLRQRDYTAPVEWGAFNNKLYLISYGQEALGIIIESEQIATAFKQLFNIMESGQQAQPWYASLPIHTKN